MNMALFSSLGSSLSIAQLIYRSYAVNSEDRSEFERDLRDLLDCSQTYNSVHDITGVLMTDGRMFAHVVEGLPAAVRELYSRIRRDKRHDRVLTLQHVLVHVRLFGAWPAAFLRVGTMARVAALDARSTPAELGKASAFVLRASVPLLLG